MSFTQRVFAGNGKTFFIGEVGFPSGKILCADPFLLEVDLLQKQLIPAGTGKAYVYMMPAVSAGTRVAYAWLQLKDTVPEQWEEAMHFPVDSGLACFVDAGLAADFSMAVNSFPGNYYDGIMAAGFRKNAIGKNREGDWLLHDFGAGNMAVCSSGMGDGQYTSWWGMDKSGTATALLIDFKLGG